MTIMSMMLARTEFWAHSRLLWLLHQAPSLSTLQTTSSKAMRNLLCHGNRVQLCSSCFQLASSERDDGLLDAIGSLKIMFNVKSSRQCWKSRCPRF